MKKWSLREDYIVCQYTYEHIFKSDVVEPLHYLIQELQGQGFEPRSEVAIQKRIRNYLTLFEGKQSPYVTSQVFYTYYGFMDRIINPSRYESIKSYIAQTFNPNDTLRSFGNVDVLQSSPLGANRNDLNFVRTIDYQATFPMVLQKYVDLKGIKKHTNLCKTIGMKPDTFSAILRGKYKEVKKDNILRLCVGLELRVDEAEELLNSAGYMLSNAIMTDVIVKAFLWNRIYSVVAINTELYENNAPLLFQDYVIEYN